MKLTEIYDWGKVKCPGRSENQWCNLCGTEPCVYENCPVLYWFKVFTMAIKKSKQEEGKDVV